MLVAWWVGAGAALTAAVLAISGRRTASLRYASVRGYLRLSIALAV